MVNTGDGRHSIQLILQQINDTKFENNFAVISLKYNYNDEQFYYDMMDLEYKLKNKYIIKFENINNNKLSFWDNRKLYIYKIENSVETLNRELTEMSLE